ncbi:flagellar basal body L-ring protein FlgH [Kistimonas asteriae]|uniref:flagellar basal body L-ring protein FlgH n=1 Tax=Kistimonas asteriae TaxID=517724 RepID=UPI001BA9DC5A|nr:flagellar basal body L-ring protein FlgH [Kistimonas asteriae]
MNPLALRLRILLILLMLSGCQLSPMAGPIEESSELPDIPPSTYSASPGSLFRGPASASLFEDRRAYREGDILTVVLAELTRSSKAADTTIGKNSAINMPDPVLFGRTGARLLGSEWSLQNSMDMKRNFSGKASNEQNNLLTGYVSVVVQQVLDNGSLYVKGHKQIRLGQGDEIIYLSGLVRPEDITLDNRVSSLRLANAKISYTGKGDMAEANVMGWMGRFFNSRWSPF